MTSLRAIRKAARCLLETLGAPDDTAGDIEIALGEALANAHEHAYPGAVGPIDIDFEIELDEFSCRIRDYGRPVAVPPRVPHGPSVGHHRGLYLMDRLMDMMEITPAQDSASGIEVRMRRLLVQH
jgi:anti-sigma regulatory factor (Ser/Thr protein kinase)